MEICRTVMQCSVVLIYISILSAHGARECVRRYNHMNIELDGWIMTRYDPSHISFKISQSMVRTTSSWMSDIERVMA